MIDTEKLKERMREKGIRQTNLASELNLANSTLSLKINNARPLALEEAEKIARILNIPDKDFGKYFFAQ